MKTIWKVTKIYILSIGVLFGLAMTWGLLNTETESKPKEAKWAMPSFDIMNDPNIHKILKTGLI